ncbi:hypothetical protein [Embleya sp. NPDC005575]|uniref:hypothetical protein n=1 Tax=Embleya sp. NPDC005575 TaxID=3156892 RepID=UPI00339E1664
MRYIVAGQVAVSAPEFVELATGVDPELFAGVRGESAADAEIRRAAAADVLADLVAEGRTDLVDLAHSLLRTAPVALRRRSRAADPTRLGAVA